MEKKKLRFAPLIRVSTEQTKKKGDSIEIQRKMILSAVERLKGYIPKHCWQYVGQEHATADYERKLFDQLLEDCKSNLFDAVIVSDLSRWARDNLKSKIGLKVLKENNIRFFDSLSEYNLYDPTSIFQVDSNVASHEYSAKIMQKKSILTKIERAKRGIPSSGSIPQGRIYDKDTGRWSVNKQLQEKVKILIDDFLSGTDSLTTVCRRHGYDPCTIRNLLLKNSGPEIELHFKSEQFDIDETIKIAVPEFLPAELLDRVKKRIRLSMTIYHGKKKIEYLLSRMVLCGHCGFSLTGMTKGGHPLYRHVTNKCKDFYSVPGKPLEDAVMNLIIDTIGDKVKLQKALEAAIPDADKIKKMVHKRQAFESEVQKLTGQIGRLIDKYAESDVPDFDNKINSLNERRKHLQDEIAKIDTASSKLPDLKQTEMRQGLLKSYFKSIYRTGWHLEEMTFKDKRELLQTLFTDKLPDGSRSGIYIFKIKNKFKFQIRAAGIDLTSGITKNNAYMGP